MLRVAQFPTGTLQTRALLCKSICQGDGNLKKNLAELSRTVLHRGKSCHEGHAANKSKPLKWLARGRGAGLAN